MAKKFLTKENLNDLEKDSLIEIILQLQEKLKVNSSQRFSRSSEQNINEGNQISMFNEVEECVEEKEEKEEETETISYTRKKRSKGKKELDLKNLPVEVIDHKLSKEELDKKFPKGYKKLPDEISRQVKMIPAKLYVEEHHVKVYASKDSYAEKPIIKAKGPKKFLKNSIASSSIVSTIMAGKYDLALPLNRLEKVFSSLKFNLSKQTMSNWVIKSSEKYLKPLYEKMREELLKEEVIQADETTVNVNKDGREKGSKSYMWLYRNSELDKEKQILIFEYQKTRARIHPKNFLSGFNGYLLTDGYPGYDTLAKENEGIILSGVGPMQGDIIQIS